MDRTFRQFIEQVLPEVLTSVAVATGGGALAGALLALVTWWAGRRVGLWARLGRLSRLFAAAWLLATGAGLVGAVAGTLTTLYTVRTELVEAGPTEQALRELAEACADATLVAAVVAPDPGVGDDVIAARLDAFRGGQAALTPAELAAAEQAWGPSGALQPLDASVSARLPAWVALAGPKRHQTGVLEWAERELVGDGGTGRLAPVLRGAWDELVAQGGPVSRQALVEHYLGAVIVPVTIAPLYLTLGTAGVGLVVVFAVVGALPLVLGGLTREA